MSPSRDATETEAGAGAIDGLHDGRKNGVENDRCPCRAAGVETQNGRKRAGGRDTVAGNGGAKPKIKQFCPWHFELRTPWPDFTTVSSLSSLSHTLHSFHFPLYVYCVPPCESSYFPIIYILARSHPHLKGTNPNEGQACPDPEPLRADNNRRTSKITRSASHDAIGSGPQFAFAVYSRR